MCPVPSILRCATFPPMEGRGIIERAFEIAPEYGSISDVKRKLIDEGYLQVNAHLSGRRIRADIIGRLNPQLTVPR